LSLLRAYEQGDKVIISQRVPAATERDLEITDKGVPWDY
jgi:hypothetical protein